MSKSGTISSRISWRVEALATNERNERAAQSGLRGAGVEPQLAAINDECNSQSRLLRLRHGRPLGSAKRFRGRLTMAETVAPGLERRLRSELTGDVMFDRFTRGRYAT